MIVIYTQDKTYIRKDANSAKSLLISVYGDKLGEEAYNTMRTAREGASFRKNGGPLLRVVNQQQAAKIRDKETSIGLLQDN